MTTVVAIEDGWSRRASVPARLWKSCEDARPTTRHWVAGMHRNLEATFHKYPPPYVGCTSGYLGTKW